jgi:lysophospholipase L1-like esterase
MTDPRLATECRLGVLAFGDSITNGGGELQWGVALQSWALWVARGLGLPFTGYATDGACARDVVLAQIPAFQRQSANPHARYELGCLYIGVNDVRATDWNATTFEALFREALSFLRTRCELMLTVTAPLDLGRPRAGSRVRELNAAIARVSAENGARVLDLSAFGARNLVMPDQVHPTAFGQIAIAERALELLEREGARTRVHPSALTSYRTTWWGRLRGDARYVYRRSRGGARVFLSLSASTLTGRR